MNSVQEALDAWHAQYAGQPPVGFMLRFSHDAVWSRLDYGNDSAAGKSEPQQLASHFDAVAGALFTGATVLVMTIEIDPADGDTQLLRNMGGVAFTPPEAWVEELATYLPGQPRMEFLATTLSWRRGLLDSLWLAVAMDLVGRVAVFCPATGDAFLPCGCGADLFVWGTDRRIKLRDRFRQWLPRGNPEPAVQERVGAGRR